MNVGIMDDTQASVKVTETSAATRKRRSSILKSQRAPRTPFSELEFNVATPTDTAKSRRVSFSRRTGVAEFVTNEATTTWKNFYEEHNKSLESSGNESAANAPRQIVGHIGKRIFDQQFEEVEVVDIGGTLQTNTLAQDFQTSLNNINITQQLASLECTTDDRKLNAPKHFELSSLTDHQSKVFGDEFSIPMTNEMSNPININFSNLQPMGDKCDDLDEIQKDLERSHQNVVCPGPFRDRRDMSEYIEIDLNMTNVVIKNDDCDMSITDTIHSPKVQEVKTNTSAHTDKKLDVDNDWVVDKENIAVNPYITPKESINFAINEAEDKVLVFDGKKLTVQTERSSVRDTNKRDNFRNTLLPSRTDVTPQRKTITLNVNDDLPNFMPDGSILTGSQILKENTELKQTVIYNEGDLSITQAIDNKIVDIPKRKTIVFEDDMGNISMTQAVPAKVIINKQEKRKTIIYENETANISMTQAMPSNIISNNKNSEKRKTIVYEDDNISFTQALPANVICNEKSKQQNNTMYYQDDADMSVTKAISENIIASNLNEMRCNKTDLSNISMTQAIPNNIIFAEDIESNKAKTILYDPNIDADIDTTTVLDGNIVTCANKEKRRTIVYDEDNGDISITQAVPANVFLKESNMKYNDEESENKTQNDLENKAKTSPNTTLGITSVVNKTSNKRKTIIYDNDEGDISMTQVMPTNILKSEQIKDKVNITSDLNSMDISMTRVLPTNILIEKSETQENTNKGNIVANEVKNNVTEIMQNHSMSFSNNVSNLSMTKPIPSDIVQIQNEFLKKVDAELDKSKLKSQADMSLAKNNLQMNQELIVCQAEEIKSQNKQICEEGENKTNDCQSFSTSVRSSYKSIIEDKSLNTSINSKSEINNKFNYSLEKDDNMECESSIMYDQQNNVKLETPLDKTNSGANTLTKTFSLEQKSKKSILSELLDMSNASIEDVAEEIAKPAVQHLVSNTETKTENNKNTESNSGESLFIITNSENDIKAPDDKDDKPLDCLRSNNERPYSNTSVCGRDRPGTCDIKDTLNSLSESTPAIDYKEESDVQDLHNKIASLKEAIKEENKSPNNRLYEKIVSSDVETEKDVNSPEINNKSVARFKKSFKNADDTNELLEMLSDFTDGGDSNVVDEEPIPVEVKEHLAIENKNEPKRLSFAPNRLSIVLSREDLLNNISMAQAALQQSRFEIDDSSMEETQDDTVDVETNMSPQKSVRLSTEVVKTLQFEDDTASDTSIKSDIKMSPLKKTCFGETTYMRESKAKVIPTYLKDVSDNIKSLMSDLVKPMTDVMPFDAGNVNKTVTKPPSTCSTQIQANLVTSSQIDIDIELFSNTQSVNEVKNNSVILDLPNNKSVDHLSAAKPIPADVSMEIAEKIDKSPVKSPVIRQTVPGPVIVFDQLNPLNNILMSPSGYTDVHKYNPMKSEDSMCSEHERSAQISLNEESKTNEVEVERVITQYNVESRLSQPHTDLQSGDASEPKVFDSNSLASNISKPLSINRSTEGMHIEVKDTEVNTTIAMKGNKELLAASSSLTLVDDALAQNAFDVNIESTDSSEAVNKKSALRVIYKVDNDGDLLQKVDSDFTSNDEDTDVYENTNPRKRSYSPTKRDRHTIKANVDVTPKPISKMQKISNSPKTCKDKLDMNNVDDFEPDSCNKKKSSPEKKKSPKRNSTKHKNEITVQQLITEYNSKAPVDAKIAEEILDIKESLSTLDIETISNTLGVKSVEIVSSFTSSNDAREMQVVASVESQVISSVGSKVSRMNWQPDVISDQSSKNLLECSSSANVVAKIDTLSFMGRECEWDGGACGADAWSFRVMRARLRVTAKLAHSHRNAPRSSVRADTPLLALTVDPVHNDEKDPLAALCIRLAAEAMRYECTRGCVRAGDIPALLRRCVAVSRVALKWARAMRDARVRLAYKISPDGVLTLKVANIPLRSVWEVRMRISLVVEDAREGAWPRADALCARAVLSAHAHAPDVRVERLAAGVPHDWGHAPVTLWKVFRYLKNKTRDDEMMGF